MPQIIVTLLSVALLLVIFSPVRLISLYFFFRPLVQPLALAQYKLLGFPITWPFAAIIGIGVLIRTMADRQFRWVFQNIIPLYLLVYLSVASFVTTLDVSSTVSQTIKFINAILLVVLSVNISKSQKRIIQIYRGIVLSSILPMLYGYYQYFTHTGHVVQGEATSRITSFFGFANLYGIFLALILFCALILYNEVQNRREKKFYLIVLISVIISTILALNRGTWIALTVAFVLMSVYYRRHIHIKLLVGVLMGVFIAASGVIIKRFMELEEPHWHGNTFEERVAAWQVIVDNIGSIPYLGYGAGAAREAMREMAKGPVIDVPHNDYLRLLVELGLLAPVLYIIFLFREFKAAVRSRASSRLWHVNYFTGVMVVYWAIISLVQNTYHDVVVFPLFLVCCYLARQYRAIEWRDELSAS